MAQPPVPGRGAGAEPAPDAGLPGGPAARRPVPPAGAGGTRGWRPSPRAVPGTAARRAPRWR